MSTELYQQYQDTLKATALDGEIMGYDWGNLPGPLNTTWLAYCEMFREFSYEIANSLNDLTGYIHRLTAWRAVIASMSDQEKMNAAHEFIDPIATLALNLPFVIRSRFIFAAAHLSHQANRSRDGMSWNDDFPLDHEIQLNAADKHGASWRRYNRLKLSIERINDGEYQRETHDFRNAYNHRFSPRIVLGITQIVTREVNTETGSVGYSFGGIPPLTLDVVVELLSKQRTCCYRAFRAFQDWSGSRRSVFLLIRLDSFVQNDLSVVAPDNLRTVSSWIAPRALSGQLRVEGSLRAFAKARSVAINRSIIGATSFAGSGAACPASLAIASA